MKMGHQKELTSLLAGGLRGQGAIVRVPKSNNLKQRSLSLVKGNYVGTNNPISVQDNTQALMQKKYRNLIMTPPAKGTKRAPDTVGSLDSGEKLFSSVRIKGDSMTPIQNRAEYPSFTVPKPHKNELNSRIYDVAGPGYSVHNLTDNIEIKTQADTFYDHGEKERIKMSKYSINQWHPGVKIRDMYTHGFKKDFDKTDPKFGL